MIKICIDRRRQNDALAYRLGDDIQGFERAQDTMDRDAFDRVDEAVKVRRLVCRASKHSHSTVIDSITVGYSSS